MESLLAPHTVQAADINRVLGLTLAPPPPQQPREQRWPPRAPEHQNPELLWTRRASAPPGPHAPLQEARWPHHAPATAPPHPNPSDFTFEDEDLNQLWQNFDHEIKQFVMNAPGPPSAVGQAGSGQPPRPPAPQSRAPHTTVEQPGALRPPRYPGPPASLPSGVAPAQPFRVLQASQPRDVPPASSQQPPSRAAGPTSKGLGPAGRLTPPSSAYTGARAGRDLTLSPEDLREMGFSYQPGEAQGERAEAGAEAGAHSNVIVTSSWLLDAAGSHATSRQ